MTWVKRFVYWLVENVFVCEKDVPPRQRYRERSRCSTCGGSGSYNGGLSGEQTCGTCGGSGREDES